MSYYDDFSSNKKASKLEKQDVFDDHGPVEKKVLHIHISADCAAK